MTAWSRAERMEFLDLGEDYNFPGTTECHECGYDIPDNEPMINVHHGDGCSLHPDNVQGGES